MNYNMVGVVLCFVILLAGFIEIRKRSKYVKLYWQNGVIGLGLATILIHVAVWYLNSTFWEQWSQQRGFAAFQILFGLGIYFIMGEITKRWKYLWPYGGLLTLLAGIGIGISGWHAYQQTHTAEEIMSLRASRATGPLEKEVTSYWKENLSEQDATIMIRIARRVSGFRQYDQTNSKEVYHNPSNRNLVGVMGIDQDKWAERSAELGPLFDIYSTRGNLKFALWLQQQQGLKPWASILGISQETPLEKAWTHKDPPRIIPGPMARNIVAPVDDWSEPVRIMEGHRFKNTQPADVWVRVIRRNGSTQDFADGPGLNPQVGNDVRAVQFRSRGKTPVDVTLVIY